MTLKEEIQLEDLAMNNAYDMIVNDKSLDDILDTMEGKYLALPFDYDSEWDVVEVLNTCMDYFVYTEEYEKCAQIKLVLDELKYIKDDK
jgi:hypothetical protein